MNSLHPSVSRDRRHGHCHDRARKRNDSDDGEAACGYAPICRPPSWQLSLLQGSQVSRWKDTNLIDLHGVNVQKRQRNCENDDPND